MQKQLKQAATNKLSGCLLSLHGDGSILELSSPGFPALLILTGGTEGLQPVANTETCLPASHDWFYREHNKSTRKS